MSHACPVCGHEWNGPRGNYCPECGALLPAPLQESAPPAEVAAAPEGKTRPDELLEAFTAQFCEHRIAIPRGWIERLEKLEQETENSRRNATMIFVDLRGYTRLSGTLGEDRLAVLRSWFFEKCTLHVQRHGGFVIQLLGDAVFAAFGAPWAFERDTQSAIECLLEIRDAVRERGSFDGEPLSIRAGATNGIVVVGVVEEGGRKRPDIAGPAVNLAARLEDYADTWDILIPSDMLQLLGEAFETEERPPFEPKNYGRTIHPVAVKGRRSGGPSDSRRHDLPLVGRNQELSRLLSVLGDDRFCVLHISGDPGIGKTRLVWEALKDRRHQHALQVFHEPHFQHLLLGSIVEWAKALARTGHPAAHTPVELLDAISQALGGFINAGERSVLAFILGEAEAVAGFRNAPASVLRSILVPVLAGLVARTPGQNPIITFDDFQWTDPMSLEVLNALRRIHPKGMKILLIGREGETPLGAVDDCVEMPLTPLADQDCRALLAEVIDPDHMHPRLRERLLQSAEGIPLIVVEMASALAADGSLSVAEIAEELTTGRPIERQTRLAELFQARIDRLSAQQRTIIQCGAVLGRRFREELLHAFDELCERLLEELSTLKGLRFLKRELTTSEIQYWFSPPAVRDFAYQMLTVPQRRSLHALTAQFMSEKYAERRDEFALEIAEHWARSGDLVRARPLVRRAAQQALRLGAPESAYAIIQEALRKSESDQRASGSSDAISLQQIALLEAQAAQAARAFGDYKRSLEHIERWRTAAETVGNKEWQIAAQYQEAFTLYELGELARCEELISGLLILDDVQSLHSLRIRLSWGNILYRRGDFAGARSFFDQIIDAPDDTHLLLRADALSTSGLCEERLGRIGKAEDFIRRAIEAYREGGSTYGQHLAINNLGIILERQGKLNEARGCYQQCRDKGEQSGYIHLLAAVSANLANIHYLLHEFAEAERESARSLSAAEMINHGNSKMIALNNLALAREGLGQLDEAEAVIMKATSLAEEMGDRTGATTARLDAAWIALRKRDTKRALALLQESSPPDDSEEATLKSTLTAALESIETGILARSFAADQLKSDLHRIHLAAALRRLDVIERLELPVSPSGDASMLAALRRSLLAGLL